MKNLVDRIIKLRGEIKDLDRSRKLIQTEINKKEIGFRGFGKIDG